MFRSKLESKVSKILGPEWRYEGHRINYTMKRKYIPDFHKENIVLEVKGFFRPGDQAKYLAIRDALLAEGRELIFVFSQPSKPVRKGAKLTHALWCEKHEIKYTSVAQLREFLLEYEREWYEENYLSDDTDINDDAACGRGDG